MRIPRSELLALGAILSFALLFRLAFIDRPFHRDPEGCGSFYGLLARNYWRYDLSQTLGVPVMSMGVAERPTFYPNHPPLVPLLVAGSFGMAGYTGYTEAFPPDWLVRLPTALFTLGCIPLIWWLLRRDGAAPRAALTAAAVFAAMPMTLVFGGLVDVIGTQLVFFALVTILAYLRLHRAPSMAALALMTLAFLPAALTDWPAFFLVPVLGLHFILTRRAGQWPWIVGFGLIAVVLFLIPYGQVVLVLDDWTWMSQLLHRRALSNVSDSNATFTPWDWIRGALYGHAIVRHSWPAMILAAAWIVWAGFRLRHPEPGTRAAGLVLGWAILHVAVGRQGVFVHEWWWWPLTPGVAMAAGLVLDRLGRAYELPRRGLIDFRPVYSASVLTVALLIFALWNARSAVRELTAPKGITTDAQLDYSIVEMGATIRSAAAPDEVVMLAESDQTLSLWYYADRPIRYEVWDPSKFESRLDDGTSDLPFRVVGSHPGRAAAFVFPRAYAAPSTEPLLEHLQEHFPMRETPKFLIFNLRLPRAAQPPDFPS